MPMRPVFFPRRHPRQLAGSTLLNDLVSWYNLDETSGTRVDAVSSNDLADWNTVGFAAGKIDNAADFVSGNLERLQSPPGGYKPTGFLTVSVFFRQTVIDANKTVCSNILGNFGIRFQNNVLEAPVISLGDGTSLSTASGVNGSVVQDAWTHVVFWLDTSDNKTHLELNQGAPVIAASALAGGVAAPAHASYTWTLGSAPLGGAYFDGQIDLVGVWDRNLTAAERSDLFNGGAGLDPTA